MESTVFQRVWLLGVNTAYRVFCRVVDVGSVLFLNQSIGFGVFLINVYYMLLIQLLPIKAELLY